MATFRLDLDLDKSPRIGARVRVRQGDKESCVIEASVFDSGSQADLSGKSARFCCLKPDRTMVRDASCSVDGSNVTYTLDQQVSAVAGLIQLAYFEVLDAAGTVVDSTQAFSIEVEDGAEAGSSGVSQSYYSELDALISQYEQAIQQSQSDYEAAESARNQSFQQAEAARDAAQAENDSSQQANDAAQDANDSAQAKNNADQQLNNQMAQGLQVVILSSGQYDPGTLEPTVSGEAGKLYFVPTGEADEEDAYVEWMWVSGAWERVGMSNATIEAVSTDQIDSVVADGSPQGEQVLNLTGLSYLWAKVKAWAAGAFAALSHTHAAGDVTSGTLAADRLPVVPVAKGGTGATTASAALTALGAASESDLNDVRDSLSQTSSAALAFSSYQANVSSHDFRSVRLPGGVVRARLIWTLAQAIPAGLWHKVGTLSGEDLALVASSVEAAGNDAAYFVCSAGAGMCTLSVSPTGEVMANAVSGLSAGYSGVAVFDLTPLPS